jgi:para-aminobenzoate synthetase/4-amino-4-deoxychorismate lyase
MTFRPAANDLLLHDPQRGWLRFARPLAVLQARTAAEVRPALAEIERQAARGGRFAAGFVSYEAAPAFDAAHGVQPAEGEAFPLLWFGLYGAPEPLSAQALQAAAPPELPRRDWRPDLLSPDQAADLAAGAPDAYRQALQAIKAHIAAGRTYQVNYTYRLRGAWREPPFPAFAALAAAHAPPYAAYLETDDWAVASLSPELFFTLDGETLTGRPMKGTAPRGRLLQDDLAQAAWLHASEKNRAENVMIVDMVRNDMGRIARVGSVRVPQLFQIEKYPTVWQMTSTVQSETRAGLDEIFAALFPCASITGAPKIRTMQIIAELERSPRRIYCGAIGYYAPGRQAQFNVAIRTLRVDKRAGEAEYGVGGGIVWDSEVEEEWQETRAKARVLVELPRPFDLLETLRWSPDEGWRLLEAHLERLERSAAYFDFPYDRQRALDELERQALRLRSGHGQGEGAAQRVRLTLSKTGEVAVEAQPLQAAGDSRGRSETRPYILTLAKTPVRSTERFLYHKTTRREVYQRALAEVPGAQDALLFNERGEVTESTIANLVYELDGARYTPPVECGLLPGTQRAALLAQGAIQERALRLEELPRCTRLWLVNSVRGMWEVSLGRAATDAAAA